MTTTGSAPSSSPSGSRASTPRRSRRKRPSVPERPGQARIVAIANQKGGVGKSTTAVSLGAALADIGYRVLVVDLDPQGNASTGMGIRHGERRVTVYDVVVGDHPIGEAVVPTQVERLHGVPSTIDLAGAEIELVSQFSREARLKKAIEPIRDGSYDFVFLDCPPSLGLLTINALTAAEELIVPIQCEYYALEGLGQLLRNVGLVQQNINPSLRLTGIVMTMFDPRTKLSEQVVAEVRRHFGELVYDVVIPRTVRLSEAPGFGQPITVYDPRSRGAETYRELAREVALRPPPEGPVPSFEDLPDVVAPQMAAPVASEPPSFDDASDEPPEEPTAEPVEPVATTASEPKAEEHAPRSEQPTPPEPSVPGPSSPEGPPEPDLAAAAASPPGVPASEVGSVQEAPPPGGGTAEPAWEEDREEPPRVRPVAPPTGRTGAAPRRVVVIDDEADLETAGRRRPISGPPPEADEEETAAQIGATLRDEGAPRRRWRLFRKGGEG